MFLVLNRARRKKTDAINVIKSRFRTRSVMWLLHRLLYNYSATVVQKRFRGGKGRARAAKLRKEFEDRRLAKITHDMESTERVLEMITKLQQLDDALDFNEANKGLNSNLENEEGLEQVLDGRQNSRNIAGGNNTSASMCMTPVVSSTSTGSPTTTTAGTMRALHMASPSAVVEVLSSPLEPCDSRSLLKLQRANSKGSLPDGQGGKMVLVPSSSSGVPGSSETPKAAIGLGKRGRTMVLAGKTAEMRRKERALFDEAVAARTRLLETQLAEEFATESEKLAKKYAARKNRLTSPGEEASTRGSDLDQWFEQQSAILDTEFQPVREYRLARVTQRGARLRAMHDLADAFVGVPLDGNKDIEVKNVAVIRKLRRELLDSTDLVLDENTVEKGALPPFLSYVAEWVSSLTLEGEWPATMGTRQQRNSLFLQRMASLLVALKRRLDSVKEKKLAEEALAETHAWDEDFVATMTKQERRDRAAFLAQQLFQKQAKIDKDFEDQRTKRSQKTEIELRNLYNEQMARLRGLFGFHLERFRDTLSRLENRVADMEKTGAGEAAEKRKEIAEKVTTLQSDMERKQGVNRDIANCAILIQIEKERLEGILLGPHGGAAGGGGASNSSTTVAPSTAAERDLAIFKGLRVARCVKKKLKELDVDRNAKEKVSILTYSLRMIEARLQSKLSAKNKRDPEEGKEEAEVTYEGLLRDADRGDKNTLSKEIEKKRKDWAQKEEDFKARVEREKTRLREREERQLRRRMRQVLNAQRTQIDRVFRPKFKIFENLPSVWREKIAKTAEPLRLVRLGKEVGDVLVIEVNRFLSRRHHEYMKESKALEEMGAALTLEIQRCNRFDLGTSVFSESEWTREAYGGLTSELEAWTSGVAKYKRVLDEKLEIEEDPEDDIDVESRRGSVRLDSAVNTSMEVQSDSDGDQIDTPRAGPGRSIAHHSTGGKLLSVPKTGRESAKHHSSSGKSPSSQQASPDPRKRGGGGRRSSSTNHRSGAVTTGGSSGVGGPGGGPTGQVDTTSGDAEVRTKAQLPKFPGMLKKIDPGTGPPSASKNDNPPPKGRGGNPPPPPVKFDMPAPHPFSASGMSSQAPPEQTSVAARRKPNLMLKELDQGLGDLQKFVTAAKSKQAPAPRKVMRQPMPQTPMFKA
ncbi:unnamed protein product [Amoebophrya sp. A25]|nr:unnamed protein product [Amoebophrya sp. A25]|eukprot:GSA25T00022184001.1